MIITMENESNGETNFNWCTWNNPQSVGKGLEDLEIREQLQHY